mgnify:CR=1 FL=1
MPPAPDPRINRLLPPLLAALLAIAVYAPCLRNQFVYDDVQLLLMDPRLTDPSEWSRYWTESYNGGIDNLYRPLVSMTFAAQWALHGLEPRWPWFAVNILLHAAVSALVAVVARAAIGCRPLVAAGAGLIFAALPVHAEAVGSVVGRAETMCAAFFLGAITLASRPLTAGRAAAVWACAVGAMLSKEQGLILPLALLLQRWCFPPFDRPAQRRGAITLTLLICWTFAGYIVFRENMLKFWWDRTLLDPMQQPMIWSHGWDRALMPLVLLGRYVRLFAWPDTLSLDWGGQVIGWRVHVTDPDLWIGVVAVLAWIVAFTWALRRRHRGVSFLLLSAGASYALISNAFTLIGTNFGERLIYLPSAFLCILAAMAIGRMPRPAAAALIGLIVIAGAARTIAYIRLFDDRLRLYTAAVEDQPRSVRLRMLLASELIDRRRLDDALAAAEGAVRLQPDYHEAYLMAAVVQTERGCFDSAEALLNQALAAPTLKNPSKIAGYLGRVRNLRAASTRPSDPPR